MFLFHVRRIRERIRILCEQRCRNHVPTCSSHVGSHCSAMRKPLRARHVPVNFDPENTDFVPRGSAGAPTTTGHQSELGSGRVGFSVQHNNYREPPIASTVGGTNNKGLGYEGSPVNKTSPPPSVATDFTQMFMINPRTDSQSSMWCSFRARNVLFSLIWMLSRPIRKAQVGGTRVCDKLCNCILKLMSRP
jgi:hypothetical protein